jgi:hypothetical protein
MKPNDFKCTIQYFTALHQKCGPLRGAVDQEMGYYNSSKTVNM